MLETEAHVIVVQWIPPMRKSPAQRVRCSNLSATCDTQRSCTPAVASVAIWRWPSARALVPAGP
jgi:hypothetical protein